jgi:hypothetical protein
MFFVMTLWNATWHGPSKYKYEIMLTIAAALMALVMGVVSVYIFPEFAIDNVSRPLFGRGVLRASVDEGPWVYL